MGDLCNKIKEQQKLRKELLDLGFGCSIIGPTGPTGPSGEGLSILDTYDTEDEFLKNHPTGTKNENYLVGMNLYIWSDELNNWKNAGSLKGEKGDQGLPGESGKDGIPGAQGPAGPVAISSSEEMLFTSYQEARHSGVMTLQDPWFIPNNSEYIFIQNNTDVVVLPGVYRIEFSGAIEKADDSHGGIFYLKDDSNAVIKDLSFMLSPGDGKQMHFCQFILFRFEKETTLQVMAGILGDANTSNVVISDVNLIINKIHFD